MVDSSFGERMAKMHSIEWMAADHIDGLTVGATDFCNSPDDFGDRHRPTAFSDNYRPRLCENTSASHGISSSSLVWRDWLDFAPIGC
ncbi:hypothetical protein ACQKKX_04970, partial [Neorhizobium sp. NPDC001467]|uniref:hypothetical protein n=1 Tax=Neorhizobium sp. NPDC001467 TaxID=3390595 RepID=UPI003CFE2782